MVMERHIVLFGGAPTGNHLVMSPHANRACLMSPGKSRVGVHTHLSTGAPILFLKSSILKEIFIDSTGMCSLAITDSNKIGVSTVNNLHRKILLKCSSQTTSLNVGSLYT